MVVMVGRALSALSALALVACATAPAKDTRINTPLHARQFNSIASQYLPRPTTVRIVELDDGSERMAVTADFYGGKYGAVSFFRGQVPAYVARVDKFLEWEAIARERGDALTKDIGRAPSPSAGPAAELSFAFHSGNARAHFLVITFCVLGGCLPDQAIALDPEGARELRALLLRFETGQLKHTPVDQVYK